MKRSTYMMVIITMAIACSYLNDRVDALNDNLVSVVEETARGFSTMVDHVQYTKNRVSMVEDALNLQDVRRVTVTAYTPSKTECDSDPDVTASMQKVRPGGVAVSRDLFESGWVFGKKIYIEGVGVFTILDLMNARWENRIDVVMFSSKDAKRFGIKKGRVAALLSL